MQFHLPFVAWGRRFELLLPFVLAAKLGKKTFFRQVKSAQIAALCKDGLSERNISAKYNVGKTAVYITIVNWRLRRSYSDLKRSGRPKKTPVRNNHLMKRIVVRSPTTTIKNEQSPLLAKGIKVRDMIVSLQLTYDFGIAKTR